MSLETVKFKDCRVYKRKIKKALTFKKYEPKCVPSTAASVLVTRANNLINL
jgi:hypothetical protein